MIRVKSMLGLILFAGLIGCAGFRVEQFRAGTSDWITEGGSGRRTNAGSAVIRVPLREAWQYNAQAGVRAVPLVRDSVAIVATMNGELQAVNLIDGKRIGYKTFESAIVGTPVLNGTSVIFTTSGKTETVQSYNLTGGKIDWKFAAGPVESSPLLLDDQVFISTLGGNVHCLRSATGEEVWKFEGEGKKRLRGFRSSPSSDGKFIVVGSDDGILYALDRRDGSLVWKHETGGSIFASPVLVSSFVVVGNLKGVVTAVDIASGEVRWRYDIGAPIYGPAAADGSSIYCGASNGALYALDHTGHMRWKFSTRAVVNAAPLVAGESVIVGSMDRVLYVLDRSSGREVWRYTAEGRIRVSPVVWGDALLVTHEDKYLTLLRPL